MKKLISIVGGLVLLLALTVGGTLLFRLIQFHSAVAELKAAGHPVAIADLKRVNSAAGQEGLALLKRILGPLKSFDAAMWAADEEALSRDVDAKMIAQFEELVATQPKLFPMLMELSLASEIGSDIEGDSLEFLNALMERELIPRYCARVLAWKARVEAAQGKPDEAVLAGLEILRIARLFDAEPMLVSQLVSLATRGIGIDSIHSVIANQDIAPATRARLNQELELHDALPGYQASLYGERAFGIETISEMGMIHVAYSGMGYLDVIQDEIECAGEESFELSSFTASKVGERANTALGQSLFPAFEQVRGALFRVRSRLRALRIVNALERQQEVGSIPVSSEDLIGLGVPMVMTIDTMTGEPMKIKRVGSAWVVYSVGANLIDDGGDFNAQADWGVGPETE